MGRLNRAYGLAALATLIVCAVPAAASGAAFHWSAATTIDGAPFTTTQAIAAVSCPTRSLCVAADDHGDILTSDAPNGGAVSWHATREVDPPGPFTAISCPSRSLCVAVSNQGDIATSTRPTAGASAWRISRAAAAANGGLLDVSCPTVSLCVAVDGRGDVLASTRPTAGARSWKRTRVIPAGRHDPLVTVSCPSRSLCVAVDSRGGEVAHSDRPGAAHAWRVNRIPTPGDSANSPPAIACGSRQLCVIVGTNRTNDSPFIVTATDPLGGRRAWKTSGRLPRQTGYLFGVSCPSATFCAATGYESPVIYSRAPRQGARSWKATYEPPGNGDNGLPGVSCQSESLCVAFDPDGNVITSAQPSDRHSWTVAPVDSVNSLDALDCVSASFCVAGGSGGRLETTTDPTGGAGAWSQGTLTLSPTTISCPTVRLCVASGVVGGDGLNIDASADPAAGAGSWQIAVTGNLGEVASVGGISCPSVSLCVEPYYQVESDADLEGTNVLHSTNPAGGTAAWALSGHFIDGGVNGGHGGGQGVVSAFSCASSSLCAGGDDAGRLFASSDPAVASRWTGRRVDAKRSITAISCAPATTLCVAVDAAGNAITTTRPRTAHWRVTHIDVAGGLSAVDCPSAHLCVAVDGSRDALTSTNPTGGQPAWTRVSGIDGGLTALSCPTTSLCFAVDGDGGLIVGRR